MSETTVETAVNDSFQTSHSVHVNVLCPSFITLNFMSKTSVFNFCPFIMMERNQISR